MDLERDGAELYAISHASEEAREVWKFLPWGPFESVEAFAAYFSEWLKKPDFVCFTVRHAENGNCLGSLTLMNIRPEHGAAELGGIWYAPFAQRMGANTDACLLLLRHCFEELKYRRMEWKCDSLNEPSKRAAGRLGFKFEGLFRQHMLVKGKNRDTEWFSILDHEWPGIRARFDWPKEHGPQAAQ